MKILYGLGLVKVGVRLYSRLSVRCNRRTKSGNVTDKDRSTGRVTAVWPGSSIHYMEMIDTPRWEDYQITYCNVSIATMSFTRR